MARQTAAEWLQIKMATSPTQEMVENINVWFEQAKQMEKEQIVKAYKSDRRPCSDEDAEQYYNETYGKS